MIILKNIFLYTEAEKKDGFQIKNPAEEKNEDYMEYVSSSLGVNKDYVKKVFSIPKNGDVILREFSIGLSGGEIPAFLVCIEGLSNSTSVNDLVLRPLMSENRDFAGYDIEQCLQKALVPQAQFKKEKNINTALQTVTLGNTVLFAEGMEAVYIVDTKSWEHRGVGNPENEAVIQGPHEGFNEVLRCNTALVRKSLNTTNLVMENILLGKTSKTAGAIVYLKNITNTSLVDEVRRRLTMIDAEYIFSTLDAEQYIEEASFLPIPQMVTTERPDRVCRALTEGRVALIMNGSSHALIMPATFFDLITSAEDEYLRYPYSLLVRLLRYLAVFLSLLLPGLFVALLNFHPELILTNILIAVSSSRALVPFGAVTELIIMEICFELIKEAGIRVPGPIGSTLGIVGGLIIGQAAVEANLVSHIVIIVVALGGIASFTVPSYSLSFAFRFTRFVFILSSAFLGLFGLCAAFVVLVLMAMGTESFGVPFMSPLSPGAGSNTVNLVFGAPIWRRGTKRESYLKPKDMYKKALISRKWRQ